MVEVGGVAGDQLEQYISRIERLNAEKKTIAEDIREVFAEAKSNGFDNKIMRQILKLKGMDESDRQEQEHLLDLYKRALGIDTEPEE
jgi:uncharacterized protein (UPF0335 family)